MALAVYACAQPADPCEGCHAEIVRTYRQTGMARSFGTPGATAAVYYHQASNTYFAMAQRGGRWFQQQYQLDGGKRINFTEKSVDRVLGSGNHARTFLHRTDKGELIELPLGWYAENGGTWAMNPGYDRADHEGFRRRIGYDCMFCHNAYPKIPAGGGPRSAPVYTAVPGGIDCARCHGDGARHISLAKTSAGRDRISASIVNPARLPADRQMEVCMQCHLETTSFPLPNSIVRYEREPFSYRAGEALADFVLHFDRAVRDDRFEINSSAYRLRQSACFLKSAGRMTCTTCHNPHDIPRGQGAKEHYNAACRQCHAQVAAANHPGAGDCVACHMPRRRTDDAVHAVMTDHRIRRVVSDLLAEKKEQPAPEYRGEVAPYYPDSPPELYAAIAQTSQGSNRKTGVARLSAAIEKFQPAAAEYYLQLGDALEGESAIPIYEEALRREPESIAVLERLALALSSTKQYARAEALLKRALDRSPQDAALWMHLGRIDLAANRRESAIAAFENAARLDPDLAESYNALGVVSRSEEALRTAIRLQPNYPEARDNLANLLSETGRFEEARLHFEAALLVNGNDAGVRYDYAVALAKARRFADAQVQLEAAVRLNPAHAEAHELFGNVLGATGRLDDAIAQFREAVRLRPDSARANLALGAALLDSGNPAAARTYLENAAKGSDVSIRDQARRLLEKGRY